MDQHIYASEKHLDNEGYIVVQADKIKGNQKVILKTYSFLSIYNNLYNFTM